MTLMDYQITAPAKVTNNNGGSLGVTMTVGTLFQCVGWEKDGRLNVASNRWIPVGTYQQVVVEPIPDPNDPPTPPKPIINIRTSLDEGKTYDAGTYYEEM